MSTNQKKGTFDFWKQLRGLMIIIMYIYYNTREYYMWALNIESRRVGGVRSFNASGIATTGLECSSASSM